MRNHELCRQHPRRSLPAFQDGLQKAIHKMKEQIGSLNTRIDLYECEIDNLKDQNQRLQAALLSAEGALAMVEEDRSKIARELEAKELELAETSRQLGELEAKASKQNHELQNLDEVRAAPSPCVPRLGPPPFPTAPAAVGRSVGAL